MGWAPIFRFGNSGGGQGPPGPPGAPANVWLTGTTAPASALGREKDFYVNSSNGDLWQKQSPFFGFPPRWTLLGNLRGPAGAQGLQGLQGPQGLPGAAGSGGGGTAAGGGITKGSIYGLGLVYGSSSTINVNPGSARDSTDAVNIALSSAQTITVTTNGAINGNDRTQTTGTVTTSSANATVTGSGTNFVTLFGMRTLTGTASSSGTTVTGVGTRFLSQIAVGDLIGSPTAVFNSVSVTAIASDTSLTTSANLGASAGSAVGCVENPWLLVTGNTVQQVVLITNNTSLALAANNSGNQTAVSAFAGPAPSGQTNMHVWLGTGGSGTGVWVSTQRTTPYGVSGYTTSVRRVGSCNYDGATPAIVPFTQTGAGINRRYVYQCNLSAHNMLLVNGGTATTFTAASPATLIPPTATGPLLTLQNRGSGLITSMRPRGVGDSGQHGTQIQADSAQPIALGPIHCEWDGSAIEYQCDSGATAFIYVAGYEEALLPDTGSWHT